MQPGAEIGLDESLLGKEFAGDELLAKLLVDSVGRLRGSRTL